MGGHTVTPYELTATRLAARENKADLVRLSLLARDTDDVDSHRDLRDALLANIVEVQPFSSADDQKFMSCVHAQPVGNHTVSMVFATDIRGQREIFRDLEADGAPIAFIRTARHSGRIYSVAHVWRHPQDHRGLLLIHSPWGRAGGRAPIVKLMQRAVRLAEGKGKLSASALIPAQLLDLWMRTAEATKVTYVRDRSVRSPSDGRSRTSALAEERLIIKGGAGRTFRSGVRDMLRSDEPDQLLTLRVRDPETNELVDEHWDDLEVELDNGSDKRTFKLSEGTIPTAPYDRTRQFDPVYAALPDDDIDSWPQRIHDGTVRAMLSLRGEVNSQGQ